MNIVYNIYKQVGSQLTFLEFFDFEFVTLDSRDMFIDLDINKGDMLPHIKRV